MRSIFLLACAGSAVALASGCRTCDDRPHLFDRLFHRNADDCPSRSSRNGASLGKPCGDLAMAGSPMVPQGYAPLYTTPVTGAMPAYLSGPFTSFPALGGSASPPPGPENELPMPSGGSRLPAPATPVPTGSLTPIPPASASRVTSESR